MNRDDAIKKIKKCLALAASPNPHEAAAAMRQAQKLMAEHGLNETDLSIADVSEQSADARQNVPVPWECQLSIVVADAFGCKAIYRFDWELSRGAYRRKLRYRFIGVGSASELASYTYTVLARQCAKDRAAHIAAQPKSCKPITKTARGDKFALGWVWGVQALVEKFAYSDRNDALIGQYMDMKYQDTLVEGKAKDRAKGRNVSDKDTMHGHNAGRNAKLDRGVTSNGQTQGLLT